MEADRSAECCPKFDPEPWDGKEVVWREKRFLKDRVISKVFEGPYRNMGKWVAEMKAFVQSRGKTARKLLFFYTTCPVCVKKYGKNYVVILAEL
jgi:hypothetical protein